MNHVPHHADDHLAHVRRITGNLDGCIERAGDTGPVFEIANTALCSFHDGRAEHDSSGDHDSSAGGRIALWCAAPPGVPGEMVDAEPSRFFHPPSTGASSAWLGVYLDGTGEDAVDWDEIAAMIADAHLTVTGSTAAAGHTAAGHAGAGHEVADSPGTFRFTARLWIHDGGSWYFATVPPVIAAAIDLLQAEERRGFGSRRVHVTIGATSWDTSIFPDAATTSYVLPVKKAVRTAERLGEGDDAEITIELVDVTDALD